MKLLSSQDVDCSIGQTQGNAATYFVSLASMLRLRVKLLQSDIDYIQIVDPGISKVGQANGSAVTCSMPLASMSRLRM